MSAPSPSVPQPAEPERAPAAALMAATRRPRLIATDLDGTVIGYQHTRTGRISPRTVAALTRAHDEGVTVVFVTGRPLRWLAPLRDQLGEVGPVICSNGAVVVDPATGDVLGSHELDRAVVDDVVAELSRAVPGVSFGAEALEGFFWEQAFGEQSLFGDEPGAHRTLQEALPEHARVVKLMARSRDLGEQELVDRVRDLVGATVTVTHSAPGMALVEMAAPGVHKAATLEEFAGQQGVGAHEVVAFGDMPNDLEMLDWAGLGLAVASGHESLRAAADGVVGACDEDGVAEAIEHLLRLPAP